MHSAGNRRDIYAGNVDTPAGRNLKSCSCFRTIVSFGSTVGEMSALALLGVVKFLKAKDKVVCIALSFAFLFNDHLSFAAYFQPNLIVAVLIGKISASICAIVFAICLLRRKPRNLSRIIPALLFND